MELPKQKISYTKRTEKFWKNSIDAAIKNTAFSRRVHSEAFRMYQYYNGQIPESEYRYVTNPYNADQKRGPSNKYPARIRNYNIIKPTLTLLLGENSKRPLNHAVTVGDSSSVSAYEEYLSSLAYQNAQAIFINELNNLGMEITPEQLQEQPPEHLQDYARLNFKDKRAEAGQEALNYILALNEWPEQVQQNAFDWFVAGETYSYKYIQNGEVIREVVSPLELDYDRDGSHTYLEDANVVVRRRYMQLGDIIERFWEVLTPQELDDLENWSEDKGTTDTLGFVMNTLQSVAHPTLSEFRGDSRLTKRYPVYHVCWQGMKKVFILGYIDPVTGNWEEQMYDEAEFPGRKEVAAVMKSMEVSNYTLEDVWVNEVLEGFRIGENIYKYMQPCEVQRISSTNPAKNKLPYNGRVFSDRHTDNSSLCKEGIAYQLLYNIFHFRLELTIAKNKGKIALLDINAIPKKHGWDEEKFMWMMDSSGYAFVDSTAENSRGTAINFAHYQVLDMELGEHIQKLMDLLAFIKHEWEESVGITRQRKGQTAASEGVSNVQQSVFQSSLITEEHFRRFDHFLKMELQGLLDYSKLAWPTGKKKFFIRSDGGQGLMNISQEDFAEYTETDFNVFVYNAGKEIDTLEQMRQHAQAFAQNGYPASSISKILSSDNMSKLVGELEGIEAKMAEQAAAQAEAEKTGMMEVEQIKQQMEMAKMEHESMENHLDRQHELMLEGIRQEGAMMSAGGDTGDPERNAIEREKMAMSMQESREKSLIELQKIHNDARLKEKELALKKHDIDTKLAIAKENKNKHDK